MAGSETQASVFETLCERLSIADPTRLLAREHLRALAASSEQDPCSCVCVLYLASAAMEQPPLPLPLLLHAANVRFGEFLDLMHELPLASGTEAEVRFRSLEHHVAVLGIIYDKYTSLFDKHMARQRGLVSPLLRAFGWQLLAYLREITFQSAADLLELFRLALSIVVYLGQPPLNLLHHTLSTDQQQQHQQQQPIQTDYEALQVLVVEFDAASLGSTIDAFYRERFLPHVQSLFLALSITPYDNSAWSDEAFIADATQKLDAAFASRQHAMPEFDARIFLDPSEAEGLANRLSAQSRNYFMYTPPPQLVANPADSGATAMAMSSVSSADMQASTAPPTPSFLSSAPPLPATDSMISGEVHEPHQQSQPQLQLQLQQQAQLQSHPHQPQAFLQPDHTSGKIGEPQTPMRQTLSNALWLERTVENTSANLQPGLKRYLDALGFSHDAFTRRYIELCNIVDFKTYADRRELAIRFYLYILQEILQAEETRLHTIKFPQLLSNETFHRALLALSIEIVQFCFKMDSNCMTILDLLEVKPLEVCKLIEIVIRCLGNPPRAVVQRLTAVEETVLQVRAWEDNSPIHGMLSKELQEQLLEAINHPPAAVTRSPATFASPISRVRSTQPTTSARRLQFGAPAAPKPSTDTLANEATSAPPNDLVVPAVSVTGAPDTPHSLGDADTTPRAAGVSSMTAAPPSMPPPSLSSTAASSPAPKHSYTLSYGLQSPQPGLMSPFRSPRTSRNAKENSLELIFRKVVGLAARRARELCVGLQIPSVLFEQISSALSSVIICFTDILRNRHLDQILICTLYGVCRANKHDMTFQRIIDNYRLQAQASPSIWRDVVLSNKTERGDIIKFYNDIFINRLETFILRFCPPRSTLAHGLRTPSRLKPPSSANVPESIPQSPIKIASTHNMYISPISQRTRAVPGATSRFSIGSSPSQELNRINSSMVRKRLELDASSIGEPAKRRRTDSAGGSTSINTGNANPLTRSSDSRSSSASGEDEDAIREAAISGMEQLAKSPTKGMSRSNSWSPSTNKSKRSRKSEVNDSPSQSGNNSSAASNGAGGNAAAASPAKRSTSRTSSSSSSNGASSGPSSPSREVGEPTGVESESANTRKSSRKRTKRVLAE